MTEHLPNEPFTVNDPKGFNVPLERRITHDLWHRFYQNQMQINGGKNDMFVAWADSGALVMGHWRRLRRLTMWKVAQKYTLADNFFMGGFGGSFLNHQWLICACAPYYPNADTSAAKPSIAVVDRTASALKIADNSPKSALDGIPKFVARRQPHAGFLRSQHDAAAVPAERQRSGRRAAIRAWRIRPNRRRCRRRRSRRSATC